MRNKPWNRDELILALETYLNTRPSVPDPRQPAIVELSLFLRHMSDVVGEERARNFRSPDSVVMKLMNFRAIDPSYPGAGLKAGSKADRLVWKDFSDDPDGLSAAAATIRAHVSDPREITAQQPEEQPEFAEAPEGKILTRIHILRERNRKIVQRKKAAMLKESSRLACEVYGFDFEKVYGNHGKGFIECHHIKPLHTLTPRTTTKIDDLALLCANCHRMIHAKRPWLSLEELVDLLRK